MASQSRSQWLRKPTMAIALTFVQAVLLSRAALFELLPEFPSAYRVIRRAAYILALRRYIVTAAEALRTQQATAASDDPRSKPVASWSQVTAVSRVVGSMANGPSADAPSVNDALAAMREKQKEVEDNLSKASRASALLLAPVEVAPFQGVSSLGNGRLGRRSSKPNSAVNVEEEDAANMVEHTAALASLKQQVGPHTRVNMVITTRLRHRQPQVLPAVGLCRVFGFGLGACRSFTAARREENSTH